MECKYVYNNSYNIRWKGKAKLLCLSTTRICTDI